MLFFTFFSNKVDLSTNKLKQAISTFPDETALNSSYIDDGQVHDISSLVSAFCGSGWWFRFTGSKWASRHHELLCHHLVFRVLDHILVTSVSGRTKDEIARHCVVPKPHSSHRHRRRHGYCFILPSRRSLSSLYWFSWDGSLDRKMSASSYPLPGVFLFFGLWGAREAIAMQEETATLTSQRAKDGDSHVGM